MDDNSKYLRNVRTQYEHLPYPPRDPEEERTRLLRTTSERLTNLNHYCYRGRRRFEDFRVLVAGGGTGDATVYIATQLKNLPGAKVVHLDMSKASMEVARQRIEVRGLGNVEWMHASLLDLPKLGVEPFDLISCAGVLHHLEDPDEGLRALAAVTDPKGALSLMVYGQVGRTGVYQIQELMRRVNAGTADIGERLDNTKRVLASLPPSNWFKRGEEMIRDHIDFGDSGIFDLFLHEQDRAYTVHEVYDYVERAGLHFIDYVMPHRAYLEPSFYITDPELLEKITAMPLRDQRAIMELMTGMLHQHHFYTSPTPDRVASVDDLDNVIFPGRHPKILQSIVENFKKQPGQPLIGRSKYHPIRFDPGGYGPEILSNIDGKRTLGEIFAAVRESSGDSKLTDAMLLADFKPLYGQLSMQNEVLLRHKSVPDYPEILE
ncbi:MAG: class I SAM-dependent methyltransferase [Leptospirillia bacterium]